MAWLTMTDDEIRGLFTKEVATNGTDGRDDGSLFVSKVSKVALLRDSLISFLLISNSNKALSGILVHSPHVA